MTQYIVNEDLTNCFRKPKAKKGDVVSLIALHGEVAIVENKSGDRFSIHINLLTEKIK